MRICDTYKYMTKYMRELDKISLCMSVSLSPLVGCDKAGEHDANKPWDNERNLWKMRWSLQRNCHVLSVAQWPGAQTLSCKSQSIHSTDHPWPHMTSAPVCLNRQLMLYKNCQEIRTKNGETAPHISSKFVAILMHYPQASHAPQAWQLGSQLISMFCLTALASTKLTCHIPNSAFLIFVGALAFGVWLLGRATCRAGKASEWPSCLFEARELQFQNTPFFQ